MSGETKRDEGWHRPPQSRKFHWFIDGGARSLCGKWGMAFGAELQAGEGASKDDCTACGRALTKRRPEVT